MENKKYTLDRMEDSVYVFLDYPNEVKQLLVPVNKYSGELAEGDIVNISIVDSEYNIKVLQDETTDMRNKVSSLPEKFKNRNK